MLYCICGRVLPYKNVFFVHASPKCRIHDAKSVNNPLYLANEEATERVLVFRPERAQR